MSRFEEALAETIRRYMAAAGVPGASIAAAGPMGRVERGFGYASLEEQRPASASTIYGLASITKVFTAVAVMQLVEQGRLSLDDPVEKYLPVELRVRGRPVTVEHLLSHTSGIPALGYAEASINLLLLGRGRAAYQAGEVLELLSRAARTMAVAEPGERFFYLNEGYVALGYVVERVSGLGYREYVERRIAEPLGVRVYLDPGEAAATGELAAGYARLPGSGLRRVPATRIAWSDGGLYGSASAAERLMEALARGGEPLLSRSSVEEMTRPRALLPAQIWGDDAYGLGVTIYQGYPLGRLIGHSGSLPGYRGFAGYIEGRGVAAALLGNSSDFAARDAVMEALAAAEGVEPPWARWARVLGSATGLYEGYMGNVVFCVERLGSYLRVRSLEPPGLVDAVMVPEEIGAGYAAFTVLDGVKKLRAEIVEAEKGWRLFYERYVLEWRGSSCPGG